MSANAKIVKSDVSLDDIFPLAEFIKRYPQHGDEDAWRWKIFNRSHNGLAESGAVVKRAGRWNVVLPRLRDWLLTGAVA